jgi:hypothetical protein
MPVQLLYLVFEAEKYALKQGGISTERTKKKDITCSHVYLRIHPECRQTRPKKIYNVRKINAGYGKVYRQGIYAFVPFPS